MKKSWCREMIRTRACCDRVSSLGCVTEVRWSLWYFRVQYRRTSWCPRRFPGMALRPMDVVSPRFRAGLLETFLRRALGKGRSPLALPNDASLLRRFVNPDSALSKALTAGISSVLVDAVGFVTLRAMGIEVGFQYLVKMILPATAAWSVVLILPVDGLQRRLAEFIGRIVPARGDREKEVAAWSRGTTFPTTKAKTSLRRR